MRASFAASALAVLLPATAVCQGSGAAIVIGQVNLRETGLPLGYTVVAIPSIGRQQFTNDRGGFTLHNLPAGPLLLRFKHIGNTPRDTTVILKDNDTLRVTIVLEKLVIQLPAMMVTAGCAEKKDAQADDGILAALFDQVQQNAERYKLLADSNPFNLVVYRVMGTRTSDGKVEASEIDTIVRQGTGPKYIPGNVLQLGSDVGLRGSREVLLTVPELPTFADTAFTNNHCLTYGGQQMIEGDSVIAVDFEPVPSLKKEPDFRGTFYVRVDGYQLVAASMELTNVPSRYRTGGMTGVTATIRFSEIVPGVAVLERSQLTTRFRNPRRPFVEIGQVFGVKWTNGPP